MNKSFIVTEKIANLIFQIEKLPCFNVTERQMYLEIIAELESEVASLNDRLEKLENAKR